MLLRPVLKYRIYDHQMMPTQFPAPGFYNGFFAPSPEYFKFMNNVVQYSTAFLEDTLQISGLDTDFTLTNRGIRIRLPLQLIDVNHKHYVAFLACGKPKTLFAMYLRHISDNLYTRLRVLGYHPSLIEIPVSKVEPHKITPRDCVFVEDVTDDRNVSKANPHSSTGTWVGVEIQPLVDVLDDLDFRVWFDGGDTDGHNAGMTSLSFQAPQLLPLDDTHPRRFLIVENQSRILELMIVIIRSVEEINSRMTQKVDMKILTLGPDWYSDIQLIPDTEHSNSLQIHDVWKAYDAWCEVHGDSSGSARVTNLSNEWKVEFVIIPNRRWKETHNSHGVIGKGLVYSLYGILGTSPKERQGFWRRFMPGW